MASFNETGLRNCKRSLSPSLFSSSCVFFTHSNGGHYITSLHRVHFLACAFQLSRKYPFIFVLRKVVEILNVYLFVYIHVDI